MQSTSGGTACSGPENLLSLALCVVGTFSSVSAQISLNLTPHSVYFLYGTYHSLK